jgi:hypothetical protein
VANTIVGVVGHRSQSRDQATALLKGFRSYCKDASSSVKTPRISKPHVCGVLAQRRLVRAPVYRPLTLFLMGQARNGIPTLPAVKVLRIVVPL